VTRTIWYVQTPDGEDITVIAESAEEAIDIAMEFCDDDNDTRRKGYDAEQGGEVFPRGAYRWVGFESPLGGANQVRDLEAAGVTLDHVLTRTTARPGIGPIVWEVGARDEDWCRLPAGVLCGGDE